MEKYDVVVIIAGLLTTAVAIGLPVLKLNGTISKLIVKIDVLNRDMQDLESHNHESHKRLWSHNDIQDETLADHECRLKIIEHKED